MGVLGGEASELAPGNPEEEMICLQRRRGVGTGSGRKGPLTQESVFHCPTN